MLFKVKTIHAYTTPLETTGEQGQSILRVPTQLFLAFFRIISNHYRVGFKTPSLIGLIVILCSSSIQKANAANETWTGAISDNWGTAGNWNPAVIPGGADTAIFPDGATSYQPIITLGNYNIGQLSFTANNDAYIMTIDAATLSINGIGGVGISNTGAPPINIPAIGVLDQATLHLNSVNVTAGPGISLNAVPTVTYSTINFNGTSNAGSAEIVNSTNSGNVGGITNFSDTASAGSAKIVNLNTSGFGTVGGTTNFIGTSTAGSAQIGNLDYGTTNFNGTSAASATIQNDVNFGNAAGTTNFNGNSTAGAATIINANTFGSGFFGGTTNFNDSSTAGSAQILNSDWGTTTFNGTSTADNATILNNPGGVLDISNVTAGIGIGSLSGAGNINLGGKVLTLGGLNQVDTIDGVLSGLGGSLIKTGTGDLTLTGANTYTGGTTITGGTLIGNTTSLPGNIVDNAALVFDQGLNGIFGGNISGTGTFTKLNTGTLTLTGANIYTGGTFITDGILQGTLPATTALAVTTPGTYNVDVARTIGSLEGDGIVTLEGPLTTGGNNSSTLFSGGMSGPGGLIKTGTGDLNLTGANVYTGGTTIAGGTLRGNTISLLGNIVDNAVLVFSQGFNDTFTGNVSGTGIFAKEDVGTLTLTGANTYTGGTFIDDGILQGTLSTITALTVNAPGTYNVDGARTIGSLAGDGTVTLAGPLTTGGNNSSTLFSGGMSGPGGLIKTGTGNFTLTGANTYTGVTTIAAGTLTGNTASLLGNIVDNAALVFDQGLNGTFGGIISGTGTFTKQNAGTLTLTGANTYTGGTFITGGILQGTLPTTTALTVNAPGTYNVDVARTIGSLAGNGSVTLAGPLTTGGNNTSTLFSGAMSGPGGLIKTGTGNLTLTGANTYTGGTTIAGGILTGNTASLPGNIVDNAALVFDQGLNGTFGGIISGTGTFTKQNAGTLTLTGANTYTGGTFITGGILQGTLPTTTALTVTTPGTYHVDVARTIGSLTGNGSVTLTGPLTTGGNNTSTLFSGGMSGPGGLIKTGTGNLTLTGANTYTGGTTIAGGILTGNTASLPGNIVDNAALVFDQGLNGTFGGIISGTGTFTKLGTGNLTLTGANTYTGGTTITGGTLTGNTASLPGNIVNNAALVFDQGFDGSFGGIISGTGTFTKQNAGTLTLTGANTYTGGTFIKGGILQGTLPTTTALTVTTPGAYIFDGARTIGSLAGNGTVTLAGPLTTGGNNTSTLFSGIMSGPGGLIKTGTGNFTLTGANTYTGGTTIADGTLTNNGSLVSPVTVNLGATYAGNGTSGPLTNSGLVSPGNSIGKLTVNGNYTQAPTGTLLTEIAPQNGSDLLAVTGTATLDGTLNIVPVGSLSSLRGNTYTILTANGGVSGAFTNITKPSLLSLSVNYLPGSVVINTSATPIISTLVSSGQAGILAQYLDQIIDAGTVSPDLDTVIMALETIAGSGSSALAKALEQISPDPYRELGFIASNQTNMVREAVGLQQQRILETLALKLISTANPTSKGFVSKFQQLQNDIRTGIAFRPQSGPTQRMAKNSLGLTAGNIPLNKMVQCGKTNVWVQSFGGGQNKKNSNVLPGTRNRSFGTSVGGDLQVLPNTYVGVMGGGMGTHFDWKQSRGHGNVKSYYGGLYGLWLSKDNIYVDGQATLGGDRYRTNRKINFATINRTARERHTGLSFSTDLELGYLLTVDASVIQPFLKYAYILGHENSFTEKNAGSLNVHRGSHNSQFGRGELGSIFSHFFVCDETLVYPSVKLSWVQKRSFQGKNVKFNFADQSFGTTVYGDNRVRTLFDAGISLTAQFKDGVYMTGNVEGEVGSGEKSGALQLAVGYQF